MSSRGGGNHPKNRRSRSSPAHSQKSPVNAVGSGRGGGGRGSCGGCIAGSSSSRHPPPSSYASPSVTPTPTPPSVAAPMKEKVCGIYFSDFTSNELEAAEGLLLLQTQTQVRENERKLKITFNGKAICERNIINNVHPMLQNNNVHAMLDNNIPNIVMENEYNPPDIPNIHGVPNNRILVCCKPFEKKLTSSDLNAYQNRLLLKKDHVETYFLPSLKRDEEVNKGINVVVFDMQGKTFNTMFKFWSNKYYVFNGVGWQKFFKEHNLKADQDFITVWMFRHSEINNLCFALSIRRVEA
ncbi:B3 domain-containing protein At1g20600-like [Vicia villosa]|uniref:B3 domain-containing protein At1g20600-like n=1 Tax=Vicia villosa TaxID=3911 RepID=UPI00273B0F6A|nr:B3 domain-containing protein At1g20600-like [Vicia villosa]